MIETALPFEIGLPLGRTWVFRKGSLGPPTRAAKVLEVGVFEGRATGAGSSAIVPDGAMPLDAICADANLVLPGVAAFNPRSTGPPAGI